MPDLIGPQKANLKKYEQAMQKPSYGFNNNQTLSKNDNNFNHHYIAFYQLFLNTLFL